MTRLLTLLLAAVTTQAGWAATASSQFAVRLTVSSGKCTGETVSQPAEAVVQVVCGSTGPFVNIEPPAGVAPVAFIGRAFRYPVGTPEAIEGFVPVATESGMSGYTPLAMVTEFRVVSDSVRDNHFELLISF